METNSSCKTIGVGSICLKNHDGSTRVLTDVQYILSLRMNFISLGILKAKGFAISMQDGILRVTSGTLVMMKGTKKNNLYYFQGSTIIGIAATVFSEDVVSKTTRL